MLAEPDGVDPARAAHGAARRRVRAGARRVPVHLLVGVRLADLAITDAELERQSIVGGASIYPFVQNLLLALRAEGLGAAMTTLLVPAEAEIKRAARDPRGDRAGGARRRRPPRGRRGRGS